MNGGESATSQKYAEVQVDLDGFAGAGAPYTVVTLMDVTLGTTGFDADN